MQDKKALAEKALEQGNGILRQIGRASCRERV